MKSPTLITVAPSEIAPFRGEPAPSNKQAEIAARKGAVAAPVPFVMRERGNMSEVKIASIYAGQRYDTKPKARA